ncbi:cryptochrome/photolyase family protein [Auraticoccus monumenti]|uniref:Deoxyribodipyrimidine photolyase-related protein n=1 Tax=Auraticoccus monumenti TaxID=675864 RepID=A0A1G6VQ92_9ACTN|nr:cryptochrome/photolyase family protein [Auraticoccus monumenti]SDD55025.1 deoxyribodipyrimidine photolyase-related protein [Auraticoccus monumenti]
MSGQVHVVFPNQLFEAHLEAPPDTRFVLVEDDLFFRLYRFHTQKLVLHRASMRRFADRLRGAGFEVSVVETSADTPSTERLADVLRGLAPDRITVHEVVDDWCEQRLAEVCEAVGCPLDPDDVLDTPAFLTTNAQLQEQLGGRGGRGARPRMQHFYRWQRQRLDILVDGEQPVGGQWSFDQDNRKKLPKDVVPPELGWPQRHPAVDEAVEWVGQEFPDNPGEADGFAWPTSHAEAGAWLEQFLQERLATFGPYEDAVSRAHPFLFHGVLSSSLNTGLLDPADVVQRALAAAEEQQVPLASIEGFVRQVIGWREYMRGAYVLWGRRMRHRNALGHTRTLGPQWWTGETGLDPVDLVVGRVNERAWAHHIERLMVAGNAMCLLRVHPEAVYEWFMELFIDAYDWVMVPNVYAMSQFAAGDAITTKPYVSGSNYLRKMSDVPKGDWTEVWDALYWHFVADHADVFAANPRSQMIARHLEGHDEETRARHRRIATQAIEELTRPG